MWNRWLGPLVVLAASGAFGAGPPGVARHDLAVRLDPESHTLAVVDRLDLRDLAMPEGGYRFALHADLVPRVTTPGWSLEAVDDIAVSPPSPVALEHWRLVPEGEPVWPVEVRYGGHVHHPIVQQAEEYQRSFSETPGIIDTEGIFLAGATSWYPTFGDALHAFRLEVRLGDPAWDVVSQGRRVAHESTATERLAVWSCDSPSEEIYLVAGPWTEYADRAGAVDLFAFLRTPDPALAQRYLQATRRYLALYEKMLTPYPYPSFALVENFWETGYGMPGFTLLGPRVIRFPFILTSSYPHEILHDWWGNSVYVDTSQGNWSEGLTAYLADHLFAEQRGEAVTYRRATLKKFADFVAGGEDVPLRRFTSRTSPASEAVGYGKGLMLFHMARRAMGDEAFLRALAAAAERGRFRRVTFGELAARFAEADGGPWEAFFEAWTSRPGAPRIEMARAEASPGPAGGPAWEVRIGLRQAQAEEPFPLRVPVAVTVEGGSEPVWAEIRLDGREAEAVVACPARPLRIDVDPMFDCMRRLDPLEVPPALSSLFGEEDALFVLPSDASEEERAAWREMARQWRRGGEPRVALDGDLDRLPAGPVWVLGWANRFAPAMAGLLAEQEVRLDAEGVAVGAERLPRSGGSAVLVARHPDDPEVAAGWIAADPIAAVPGLGRKLPHYSRYSWLGFRGDEPENVAKGMWKASSSPLTRFLPGGGRPELSLPARRPLADLPAAFDAASLRSTVEFLAAPERGGRGLGTEGLESATAWVEQRFRETGLAPAAPDGFRQGWSWSGGEPPAEMPLANLVARIEGTRSDLRGQPVVLLAHLDHLGRGWPDVREANAGQVHPGADDNASGVAVVLEVARAMALEPPRARPVLFAIVTGEEAGRLGSKRLLDFLAPAGPPFACVNLDTVGRLREGKLHVLNSDSAREWRFIFMGVQATTGLESTIVPEPLDSSDQISCIERGVPAVQLFTGPHADYHRPGDTADKVDAEGLARIAEAVHEVVTYLADRAEPLTVTIAGSEGAHPTGAAGRRRVSLGTMPDFSFGGPGVRVQEVLPGSPAESSGLRAGDVVVALDGSPVADLRAYSDLLSRRKPGDEVEVTAERGGARITVRVRLEAR